MKIVKVDNFDRENTSDVLIANNVHNFYAEYIAEALNKKFSPGDHSPDFFRAVENDYKPYKFEP